MNAEDFLLRLARLRHLGARMSWRASLDQLNPRLRAQAQRKLKDLKGKARDHVCLDDKDEEMSAKKKMKIPKLSAPEERLAFHLKAEGVEFVREFKWWTGRKHRADFAFVTKRLLVEVQGGIHNNGAHVRGKGYERDRGRTNEAVIQGWRVLEFTPAQINCGVAIRDIKRSIAAT